MEKKLFQLLPYYKVKVLVWSAVGRRTNQPYSYGYKGDLFYNLILMDFSTDIIKIMGNYHISYGIDFTICPKSDYLYLMDP